MNKRVGILLLVCTLSLAGCNFLSSVQQKAADVQKGVEGAIENGKKTIEDAGKKIGDVNKAAGDLKTSIDNLSQWGQDSNSNMNK